MPSFATKCCSLVIASSLALPVAASENYSGAYSEAYSEDVPAAASMWQRVLGTTPGESGDIATFSSAAQSASALAGLGVSSIFGLSALGGFVGFLYHHNRNLERERIKEAARVSGAVAPIYKAPTEYQFGGIRTEYSQVEKY